MKYEANPYSVSLVKPFLGKSVDLAHKSLDEGRPTVQHNAMHRQTWRRRAFRSPQSDQACYALRESTPFVGEIAI